MASEDEKSRLVSVAVTAAAERPLQPLLLFSERYNTPRTPSLGSSNLSHDKAPSQDRTTTAMVDTPLAQRPRLYLMDYVTDFF